MSPRPAGGQPVSGQDASGHGASSQAGPAGQGAADHAWQQQNGHTPNGGADANQNPKPGAAAGSASVGGEYGSARPTASATPPNPTGDRQGNRGSASVGNAAAAGWAGAESATHGTASAAGWGGQEGSAWNGLGGAPESSRPTEAEDGSGLRPAAVGRVSVSRPVGIDRAATRPEGTDEAGGDNGAPAQEAKTPRRRRTLLISGLVALLLLVGGGAAVAIVRPGPVDGWLAGDAEPTSKPSLAPDPTPTPVLAAAGDTAAAPSAAGVQSAISSLVKAPALGDRVSVSVVDAASGESLFAQRADTLTTPASTTKLVTAATVLAARGPAHRLTTRAVAGAEPGTVVLIGGGDPTLSVNAKGQFPGAARLDRLAEQVKDAMGDTPITKVLIDTSLFPGPATAKGWTGTIIAPEGQVSAIHPLMTNAGRRQPVHNEVGGDPRFTDPALATGQSFAKQLGVRAAVGRGTAPADAAVDPSSPPAGAPAPGTELGKVQSPPLVHVVDWMLEQSDNTIAEVLSRQVALAAGQPASFEGATAAMIAKLGELGLPENEIKLSDASGLSRLNQISPSLLTELLTLAASGQQPALSPLFGGLPVAGWSGTLRTRFVTPAPNRTGQGLVRAKTGSLSGVNAISGQLVTKDGRVLIFAILADRTGDSISARQALDKVAARLVACGC